MKLRKIIKTYYNKLVHSFFFIIYGKIEQKKLNLKKIFINNVYKIDKFCVRKFNYKVFQIKNGRVFTNFVESLAIILDNKILNEISFQQVNGYLKQNKNEVLLSGTPKFKRKLFGTTLVLTQGASGHSNYAHWLLDIIPKIIITSKVHDLKNIDNFYFSKLNNFQKEALRYMKINPGKFIDANKFRHIECQNLLAVTHPNYFKKTIFDAHSNIPAWIIYLLKKKFLNKKLKKIKFNKIFIDRGDSKQSHCKLINNTSVINLLKKKGYKVLQLSDFRFFDQISIFRNCNKIISPHGAGLANLIFCKPGTQVIEIIPDNITNLVYKRISNINKLKHKAIYVKKIKNNINGDMYFDLDKFNHLF